MTRLVVEYWPSPTSAPNWLESVRKTPEAHVTRSSNAVLKSIMPSLRTGTNASSAMDRSRNVMKLPLVNRSRLYGSRKWPMRKLPTTGRWVMSA